MDGSGPSALAARIRGQALRLGFDACGFTSFDPPVSGRHFDAWLQAGFHGGMSYLERSRLKRLDPGLVLRSGHTVISLAVSYATSPHDRPSASPGIDTEHHPRGVVARYARYLDYHASIGVLLADLCRFIAGLAEPAPQSLWYVDTGPLLERDLAQRAGLGFIGKHTNLIRKDLGNWFFIGCVLTTLEVAADEPQANRCGKCERCMVACPTQAIVAPFRLDARRCISYLTIELRGPIPVELRPAVGARVFGCDDCLEVCPWNRFAREGRILRECARPEFAAPLLHDWLSLDEAAFRKRFRDTPLMRGKRQGLLRNVCVALGNIGDSASIPALQKAASGENELVSEHAQWAIAQIQERVQRPA